MNMKNFPKRLDSKTSYLRITVPENLDLALEGLIRKVLKEQPKTDDIYSFAANYFETLLKIRDKAGAKFTADQLCPFHNDEDAHEMIKLAGTFPKPKREKLREKKEESLLKKTESVPKNKDLGDQVQDKKSVRKQKLKKVQKDEITEQNKQKTSEMIKKLPMAGKNTPEEGKKQTKLESKRSDDFNLENNTKKEESDDEEFLASDPIKELVEKELIETSGKRKEIKEDTVTNINAPLTSDELTKNKNIQEEQKVDNIKVQATINDANEPLEEENVESEKNFVEKDEENKNVTEEMERNGVKEKDIKIENNEVIEQTNVTSTSDVKEQKIRKTVDAKEASNKLPDDMKREYKESAKNKKKSNKGSIKEAIEIDPKSTKNLINISKEETEDIEKTKRSTENTEEAKIVNHHNIKTSKNHNKTSDFETIKLEEQTLTQEIQSEEKINKQSTEMIKETTDRSSETINDRTEKDTNKAICSEIFNKDNATDINRNVKDQGEKNVKTPEQIPLNEIKSEEKESKQPLNDQQPPLVKDQTDTEIKTESPVKTASKDENSDSVDENKTVETLDINIKPSVTEPDEKHDVGKVEVNNNQEPKVQEENVTNDELESTVKIKAMDVKSLKEDDATKEVLKKTEEPNSSAQTEQFESETKQYVLKSDEKPLGTEMTAKDNIDENAIRNAKENSAEVLESKTTEIEIKSNETKSALEKIINTNENIVDTKPESESPVSQTDSKYNFFEGELRELSNADKKGEDSNSETSSSKLLSDPANPNEVTKSEKKEKPLNEYRVKITEDTLFGEKTHDESFQTSDEIAMTPQVQKKEISETQEDQQNVYQITAESQLTNKEFVIQEEANVRKLEDEVSTSLDLLTAKKPNKEESKEALKSGTPDGGGIQNKDNKTESEKEPEKEKSDNQKLYFEAEDETSKREELSTEVDTHQIPKGDETNSDKLNEKSKSKYEFKTTSENEEDKSKPEELCTVVDIQQITKEDAINRNKLEEKYKSEAETIQNKEDETEIEKRTIEEEKLHIITIDEADKTEESQAMSQPSGEIQIKTIQSHYYNTLQVPETVTKEYRVHNISSPPMSALLNAASSLLQSNQPKHELLNKEERTEKIVDVNMNSIPLIEKVNNISSTAEPTKTATSTEDIKFDDFRSVDHQKNSPPKSASSQNELESATQKSDSDDLLNLMTPTSGYSLNLSELSWQTINDLFLDSEKRHSSLEKEENRYATPKTSKITSESGEQKVAEVEEIFHKAVVSSNREAVPVPPRDLETNVQTSESTEEKKEDKPEGESSSGSSNEQISVNEDTPFISVEVKTVIETQILDDDDADDVDDNENDHIRNKKQNNEEEIPPDMEIKVETTIDFRKEVDMPQSESELRGDKLETTIGTRRNSLKPSLEVKDKNRHDKPKESSSSEQTTGGEGSSSESDSTILSAPTEIKRADFGKRKFSSTRSLLSTQSLDLEKKNPLMKTSSLSTFRHGLTDFDVWNTIEKELEEAATKIQSKFRGYKTRKKLQRENAVQITTEESSVSVTPVEEEIKNESQQSTGEFHDSIVLSEHPR